MTSASVLSSPKVAVQQAAQYTGKAAVEATAQPWAWRVCQNLLSEVPEVFLSANGRPLHLQQAELKIFKFGMAGSAVDKVHLLLLAR